MSSLILNLMKQAPRNPKIGATAPNCAYGVDNQAVAAGVVNFK